jgi:hypothetical protein
MKVPTKRRRDPSLTIHLWNFSLGVNSLGASPLTSPDSNILISSVDLVRSTIVVVVVEVWKLIVADLVSTFFEDSSILRDQCAYAMVRKERSRTSGVLETLSALDSDLD